MDKDKILPLTGNEGILCFPQCHENQRDADWEVLQRDYVPKEQVKVLVGAAEPFAKGFFVDPYQSHQAGEAARQQLLIALAQLEAKEEKP